MIDSNPIHKYLLKNRNYFFLTKINNIEASALPFFLILCSNLFSTFSSSSYAGWFEREAVGYGYEFPSLKTRFEQLEESLKIIKHIWSGNTQSFEGKFITLQEPLNNPPPVSKPYPPILIGGSGEKKTLRFVAKYADACNIVIGTTLKNAGALYREEMTWDKWVERVQHKYNVLKQHCEDVGRLYSEIEKTVTTYIQLSPDAMNEEEVIDVCKKLSKVGCEHVVFNMPNVHEIKPLEIMGQYVIPKVSDF